MNSFVFFLHSVRLPLAALALAVGGPAFAQPASSATVQTTPAPRTLTKFNLDFPGGTPGELVAAIEKASGRPLNAIIPPGDTDRRLPPLKMNSVDAAQLFGALGEATNRMAYANGMLGPSQCGFRTQGLPTDDSIWYFWVNQPPTRPKVSQFFLLKPYLAHGLTVDDITTAIETAWKMEGAPQRPQMSYHKETSLLIVVGDEPQLVVVRRALRALSGEDAPASPEEGAKPAGKKS